MKPYMHWNLDFKVSINEFRNSYEFQKVLLKFNQNIDIWAMGFQQPVVPWDSRLSSQEDGPLDMRNFWDPPEPEVAMEA